MLIYFSAEFFSFCSTPSPNKAKSYLTGSVASKTRRFFVSSIAVCQSVCFLLIKPRDRPIRSTCRSQGQTNWEGEILFQIPKSTPLSSFLTIHLRNILILLQADFFLGVATCLRVLRGARSD